MTQVESLVLDIEHPAISWQAVSPSSLDGPFLNEATGLYIPTEGAQAFLIALPQPSTCPVDRYRAVLLGGQDAKSLRRRAGGHRSGEGQRLERRGPDGHSHFEFARQGVFPNFSYFYAH